MFNSVRESIAKSVALFVLTATTFSAQAASKDGAVVVSLTGSPRVVAADGRWNYLKVGDSLEKGYSIRTGEGDRVVLFFADDSRRLALSPNSSVKLDAKTGSLFLENGEAVGSFKKQDLADNTLSTRYGTASIHGEFLARGDNGNLQVLNGQALLAGAGSSSQPVAVSSGYSVTPSGGASVPKATPIPSSSVAMLTSRFDVIANAQASPAAKKAALSYGPPPIPTPTPTPVSQNPPPLF